MNYFVQLRAPSHLFALIIRVTGMTRTKKLQVARMHAKLINRERCMSVLRGCQIERTCISPNQLLWNQCHPVIVINKPHPYPHTRRISDLQHTKSLHYIDTEAIYTIAN